MAWSWIAALLAGVWQPEGAPVWATECPPLALVQAQVEARLGRGVADELAQIGARGGLDDAGVWLEIVFVSADGESTRRIAAASCADILEPAAVVIALVIDTETAVDTAPPTQVASSDPFADGDLEAPPPVVLAPEPPAPARRPRRTAERARTVRAGIRDAFVGLELGTDLVMLRETGFGGELTAGMWLGIVRLAAIGSLWLPRRVTIGQSTRATLRAGTGGLDVCVAPAVGPVQLGVCTGFEGGFARATNAPFPSSQESLAMGAFGGGLWWSVSRRVALMLRGSGLILARRPEFAEGLHRSRRYAAKVTAGLEVRFDTRRPRSAGN